MTCPDCHGEGRGYDIGGEPDEVLWHDCDRCEGTGEVYACERCGDRGYTLRGPDEVMCDCRAASAEPEDRTEVNTSEDINF